MSDYDTKDEINWNCEEIVYLKLARDNMDYSFYYPQH